MTMDSPDSSLFTLSSSPVSVAGSLMGGHHSHQSPLMGTAGSVKYGRTTHEENSVRDNDGTIINLEEFLEQLPVAVGLRKEKGLEAGSTEDPVRNLFERLQTDDCDEWSCFAHFDPTRNYTRNLIATDNETYTALLLCWNPGRASPIHDHPCDGCYMKVLEGSIQECRYQREAAYSCDDADNKQEQREPHLVCTQDRVFDGSAKPAGSGSGRASSSVVFIEDSLGYHKVGNPSVTKPAVTLHIYTPPFDQCMIWLDETRRPSCVSMSAYYSEYGTKV